jgi:hypothetical protein
MRTRTFYTTLSLMTLGLLSGCAGTNTLAQGPLTSSVALGAMESTICMEAPLPSGSPLCLSSQDDELLLVAESE